MDTTVCSKRFHFGFWDRWLSVGNFLNADIMIDRTHSVCPTWNIWIWELNRYYALCICIRNMYVFRRGFSQAAVLYCLPTSVPSVPLLGCSVLSFFFYGRFWSPRCSDMLTNWKYTEQMEYWVTHPHCHTCTQYPTTSFLKNWHGHTQNLRFQFFQVLKQLMCSVCTCVLFLFFAFKIVGLNSLLPPCPKTKAVVIGSHQVFCQ